MLRCWDRYVRGTPLETKEPLTVLNMGAADVNGSYSRIISGDNVNYIGADLAPGPGVSVVMEDAYRAPLPDGSVDIVMSGQMLEHCEYFWMSFVDMMRMLQPEGFLFLIAPSAGAIHRYPVDCYRFYPDAYRALARYAKCKLVEVWHDQRGQWRDLVGVFSWRQDCEPRRSRHIPATASVPSNFVRREAEEVTQGKLPYLEALAQVHERLAPSLYLEIGVRSGNSLALASGTAVGVDPQPSLQRVLGPKAQVVEMLSDDFFEDCADAVLGGKPDLIFIDGMHHFEAALRDFMNVERIAAPGALVVIDDIFPNHPAQASRDRKTGVWTGDVWKLYACLKQERPDLFLLPLDTAPTGLLLVWGLDPRNRKLWDRYNHYARIYVEQALEVPDDILRRLDAVLPDVLPAVLDTIRDALRKGLSSRQAMPRLRTVAGLKPR